LSTDFYPSKDLPGSFCAREENQTLNHFFKFCQVPKANYLGIDFGNSRIGIAIAPEGILAMGILVIPNDRDLFPALEKLIEENNIQNIVLGIPISMNGKVSASTRAAQEFAVELKKYFPNQYIFTYDERLTTQEAKRNVSSREPDDAEAARIILQGYLDKQNIAKNIL
jgi:putative holliday junction resolvase